MLSSVEQAFVGRDEKRAPLKRSAWEASLYRASCHVFSVHIKVVYFHVAVEPLYKKVLGLTDETSLQRTYFVIPLALCYIEVPLYW